MNDKELNNLSTILFITPDNSMAECSAVDWHNLVLVN